MNKFSLLLAATLLVSGFSVTHFANAATDSKPVDVDIKNAKGEKIGHAKLTAIEDGVNISLQVSKLAPGKHGIHFHEKGLCEGPDFKSAGGHLNPAKKEHGLDNTKGSHAGDLPNIEAKSNGEVKANITSHGATLGSGDSSLLRKGGTALVIHAKVDDQHTDPSGASGDRVACGVIGSPAE
jgi:Cu-Zn family superoxide dismutase